MVSRGQAQIGFLIGFAGIITATVAAITIIDSVSTSPTREPMPATPAPAVPLDAVLVMVLLAITLAYGLYLYGGAS